MTTVIAVKLMLTEVIIFCLSGFILNMLIDGIDSRLLKTTLLLMWCALGLAIVATIIFIIWII